MQVHSKDCILRAVDTSLAIKAIESSFCDYSLGNVQSGAVAHLRFQEPPGDFHLKSAHICRSPYFVVKMAGNFYRNPEYGLTSSNGVMMAFNAHTGHTICVLADDGALTDLRTALAGTIAARLIAPSPIKSLGIVGAGTQAKLHAIWVSRHLGIEHVQIWARNIERAQQLAQDLGESPFSVTVQTDLSSLSRACDLIVTTTPSQKPLITRDMIRPGLRIVAIGADSPGKTEVAKDVMAAADLILTDSTQQCLAYGECAALAPSVQTGTSSIIEIGEVLLGQRVIDLQEHSIAIVDLTGLGAQDAAIAELAIQGLSARR
ncbi:hypothetical protein HY29_16620 [Hyphomonas beringensis]|uniref:Ornithine cyclodeaminase n=1 Tax=Hyphomonas beringensis TaxID=1280946 RepID=A0A062U5T6_9PROT|nr:Gfo/Idh/MocA family oxidoreductase [Hyphomonas beringensis]KCZ53642.1 hypothetical protein HY29_16620 [Hyphomonas beringensis]